MISATAVYSFYQHDINWQPFTSGWMADCNPQNNIACLMDERLLKHPITARENTQIIWWKLNGDN